MKFPNILILSLILGFSAVTQSRYWNGEKGILRFPDPLKPGAYILGDFNPRDDFQPGDVSEIRFLLFTKNNKEDYEEIKFGDLDSIDNSNFTALSPLKFMVHGFGGAWTESLVLAIKNEYVGQEENSFNVVLMDWASLSSPPDYFVAFENAKLASEHVAIFFKFLVKNEKVRWEDIHLIGHSLGGQTVGIMGHRSQQIGGMIGRITALDPANPFFDQAAKENRTSEEDATFVDVIHTACNGFTGFWGASGHVDWYPNGGRYQTGCGFDLGDCSHRRAYEYFLESLRGRKTGGNEFWGKHCNSYDEIEEGSCNGVAEIMGEYTPQTARGMYFFQTNPKSPYANSTTAWQD